MKRFLESSKWSSCKDPHVEGFREVTSSAACARSLFLMCIVRKPLTAAISYAVVQEYMNVFKRIGLPLYSGIMEKISEILKGSIAGHRLKYCTFSKINGEM